MGALRLSLAIILIGAALTTTRSTLGAQSEPIRVLFYPPWNISKLPMYFLRDTNLHEKHALNIHWTNPGSNDKLLAAMKSGAADIVVASANHILHNNASGGPELKLVGNSGFNYSAFLAQAAIKSPADLKGKKVGSGEPGSTPDQLVRLALHKLGIDPDKDVTLVHFNDSRSAERAKSLLTGELAATMVTAEGMYDLEKSGAIKKLTRLTDHKQLKIYAGGGADYAITAALLKNRREDARKFMSGICEGIALARKDQAKAKEFVAKTGRNLDATGIDYLYKLYMTDVIPAKPLLKPEGIALARKDQAKAKEFVAKTGRKMDAAGIDYLYQLYMADVIPAKPFLKPEGVDLAIQMTMALIPAAASMKPDQLVDASLVPDLEKDGRCSF